MTLPTQHTSPAVASNSTTFCSFGQGPDREERIAYTVAKHHQSAQSWLQLARYAKWQATQGRPEFAKWVPFYADMARGYVRHARLTRQLADLGIRI